MGFTEGCGSIRAGIFITFVVLTREGGLGDSLTTPERRTGTARMAAGLGLDCDGALGSLPSATKVASRDGCGGRR